MPANFPPRLSCRLIVMALIGCLLLPIGAMGHAILEHSQPPSGGSVPAGKVTLSFTYNSRVDKSRSRLSLTRPDHSEAVLKVSQSGPPNVISASTELTAPGPYIVRWQVLAIDGHITRGDVPFIVTGQ